MNTPKWFQEITFDRPLLELVGVLIAACGMVERCLMNGLVHMREQGVSAAKAPIHPAFGKRHKQWLAASLDYVADDKGDLKMAQTLFDKTEKLMELRHLIVHSFWFGQDRDRALCLQQVKEAKGKLQIRSLEIEMPFLGAWSTQFEPIVDEHMHFLNNRLIRQRANTYEGAQSADADPTRLHPPSPKGWPPPGQKPQRLSLKRK